MWLIRFANESKQVLTHNKQREVWVQSIMSMQLSHQLESKSFLMFIINNKA